MNVEEVSEKAHGHVMDSGEDQIITWTAEVPASKSGADGMVASEQNETEKNGSGAMDVDDEAPANGENPRPTDEIPNVEFDNAPSDKKDVRQPNGSAGAKGAEGSASETRPEAKFKRECPDDVQTPPVSMPDVSTASEPPASHRKRAEPSSPVVSGSDSRLNAKRPRTSGSGSQDRQPGRGGPHQLRWDEILADVDKTDRNDSPTIRSLINRSIAAASASHPDVVRNLNHAKELYVTDKEAAVKMLDETRDAHSLLILADGNEEGQNAGGEDGDGQASSGNHRSVTPVEDIAAGLRSSSEQSVASEDKTWQAIIKQMTDQANVSEATFSQSMRSALAALRLGKGGTDEQVAGAMETLLGHSASLETRVQVAKQLVAKHSTSRALPGTSYGQAVGGAGSREPVLMKSGVDAADFEMRILFMGWKKEIGIESIQGKSTVVTHYVNPVTKQRYGSLDEVRSVLAEGTQPELAGKAFAEQHSTRVGTSVSNPLFSSFSAAGAAPNSLGLAARLANSHQDAGVKVSMRSPAGLTANHASSPPILPCLPPRPSFPNRAEPQIIGPSVRLVGQGGQLLQVVNQNQGQNHGVGNRVQTGGMGLTHGAQLRTQGTYVLHQTNNRGGGRLGVDSEGQQVVMIPNQRIISLADQSAIRAIAQRSVDAPSQQQNVGRIPQNNGPVVFRSKSRSSQSHPQQAGILNRADVGQAVNDALKMPAQVARLQQSPQPMVMKGGGRERLLMVSPSSYLGGNVQQRAQVQQPQQHHMQGARASLTSNALAGTQIIQTRKDQLIVLPQASSPLQGGMGLSVRSPQTGGLQVHSNPYGMNLVMAQGSGQNSKGVLLNSQGQQQQGQRINSTVNERRHQAVLAPTTTGGTRVILPQGRGGSGIGAVFSRGQILRHLGGDRQVIDLTDNAQSAGGAMDGVDHARRLESGLRGVSGNSASSVAQIQKILRSQTSADRHQLIQDALLGTSPEPPSTSASQMANVCFQGGSDEGGVSVQGNSGQQQVVLPLGDNNADLSKLLSGSKVMLNGIPVLIQLPQGEKEAVEEQPEVAMEPQQQSVVPDEVMGGESGLPTQETQENSPQTVHDNSGSGVVEWKCILRSKPTPQRPDQELFTVVGWVRPDLLEKLPETMTVAEFEDRAQLDCWPTEEAIDLTLDEETSERGRHALRRLSEMRLAAIVHLANFDFIFVPHPHQGDVALMGLIKAPKHDQPEQDDEEGCEEGRNNIHEI
ncbi:hypothetical protein BSKO_10090 [Bryopsis sp. KO-2023]|nr:hypothetical protein BSKO_10090 [Bryopsis sp. KO-2023]